MDKKKLGKKIKLARVENDLSQEQFAELIQAKQKSISRYETGTAVPSLETLIKIANALKKPAAHFLDDQCDNLGSKMINSEEHKYEIFLVPLIREIQEIIDCLQGLETIIWQAENQTEKHKVVYRECYKQFYIYSDQLVQKLKNLLFKRQPVTGLIGKDEIFQNAVEKILTGIAQENKIAKALKDPSTRDLFKLYPESYISHPNLAVREYKKRCNAPLGDIHALVGAIEKHLDDLYFQRTDMNLRVSPRDLPKSQEILKLFGLDGQKEEN